jgi:hypothetical protein
MSMHVFFLCMYESRLARSFFFLFSKLSFFCDIQTFFYTFMKLFNTLLINVNKSHTGTKYMYLSFKSPYLLSYEKKGLYISVFTCTSKVMNGFREHKMTMLIVCACAGICARARARVCVCVCVRVRVR